VKLAAVEIRDYRSIFVDEGGEPFRLELASGMTTLVGPNNCGKSNILRAISLALDPSCQYDSVQDAPGPRPFAHPVIRLRFAADPNDVSDREVLDVVAAYAKAVGSVEGENRAVGGDFELEVSFAPVSNGVRRVERVVAEPSPGRTSNDKEADRLLPLALDRIREAVRFVMISSGESIESILEGNFREILHSVVRERLRSDFEAAEEARAQYVGGLQDSLLRPLRDRLASDVGGLFPEIEGIVLTPDVSTIEQTLSNVGVSLEDIVTTPLSGKGTGVRGGVLVAMLSYLALNATRGMVFAVEEPEAFLHPAAQEDLRDYLEKVAAAAGVTLLVTTHSPFTVTRSPQGKVVSVGKDRAGRTRVSQVAAGDVEHAPLIGGLLREATFEAVLMASTAVQAGTKAVVLVEGDGDRLCFELAAERVGRPDLLDGLVFRPTGGTMKMVAQAVITRAAVEPLPVVIVVDNDESGRKARSTLTGETFGFPKKSVFSYAEVLDGDQWKSFPVEAEDLFDPALLQSFVERHGAAVIEGSKRRPDGAFHYDLSQSVKELLGAFLDAEARPEHFERWIDMILLVRTRAGLEVPAETADEIVAAAPAVVVPGGVPTTVGLVYIVNGAHDHARYLQTHALLLDAGSPLPDGVTHVGFYSRGIQPHVPMIVSDYPNLLLDTLTADQLRHTGVAADAKVADLIALLAKSDPTVVGQTRRVVLLSAADDEATLVLENVIANTKQISSRPVAWALRPTTVPLAALAKAPTNTDELDALIESIQKEGATS
jgi:putative ATP-dependent endonuclease of OLD family